MFLGREGKAPLPLDSFVLVALETFMETSPPPVTISISVDIESLKKKPSMRFLETWRKHRVSSLAQMLNTQASGGYESSGLWIGGEGDPLNSYGHGSKGWDEGACGYTTCL